jgi:SAM-dependent methyltransferase
MRCSSEVDAMNTAADHVADLPVPDVHLDLGCGKRPRNPYQRTRVCGVDVRALSSSSDFEFRAANLSVDPIPYADDSFGSVSAFDFIEHVPRILSSADGRSTAFPFIRLMNEAWRVLAHGGRLYAVTPTYPHAEAFQDPTHVNIITERTHEYFCGDNPLGRMYGFNGHFVVRRAEWVRLQESFIAVPPIPTRAAAPPPLAPAMSRHKQVARAVRDFVRRLRGKRVVPPPAIAPERLMYFLWELEAVKTAPAASPHPNPIA